MKKHKILKLKQKMQKNKKNNNIKKNNQKFKSRLMKHINWTSKNINKNYMKI